MQNVASENNDNDDGDLNDVLSKAIALVNQVCIVDLLYILVCVIHCSCRFELVHRLAHSF